MKKIVAFLLIGLQISCISADPKITESAIDSKTFQWEYEKPVIYENENSLITIYSSKIPDNIFDELYYKYAVDGDISAVHYLAQNYDICLINISNKSNSEISIELSKLQLTDNKTSYKIISPLDIPSKVKRINPKGITKNVYNTIVIIAITAAIITICHKSKSLPNLSINPSISTNNNSETTEPNDYQKYGIFSSFFHKTKYSFNDCILETNSIPPSSSKEGIVFIKKNCLKNSKINLVYK